MKKLPIFSHLFLFAIFLGAENSAQASWFANWLPDWFSKPGWTAQEIDPMAHSEFSDQLFVESAKFQIKKEKDYSLPMEISLANRYFSENGFHADPKPILAVLDSIHQSYQREVEISKGRRSRNPLVGDTSEAVSLFFKVAKPVLQKKTAGIFVSPIIDLADTWFKANRLVYEKVLAPQDQQLARLNLFQENQYFDSLSHQALSDLRKFSYTEPNYKNFMETFIGDRLTTGLTDSVEQILDDARNSTFSNSYSIAALRPFIREDGLQVSTSQLKILTDQVIDQVIAETGNAIQEMGHQMAQNHFHQEALSTNLPNLDRTEEGRRILDEWAGVQGRIEQRDHAIQAGRAAIGVLAFSVAKIFDEGTARTIQAWGHGAIGIVEAVDQFSRNLTNPNLAGAFNGVLSGAILSGNVLGAVTGLVGILLGGPTLEEHIDEQFTNLRNDMGELIQKFAEGLDKKLNDIVSHLDSRFDVVDQNLQTLLQKSEIQTQKLVQILNETQNIKTRLEDIRNDLIDLQDSVSVNFGSFGAHLNEHFRNLIDRENEKELSKCFERRSLGDSLTQSQFVDCFCFLKADLKYPGSLVPKGTPTDPSSILTVLSTYPTDETASYLIQYAKDHYGVKVDGTIRHNAAHWIAAANGWLHLLTQFPENRARANQERVMDVTRAILKQGNRIAGAVSSLTFRLEADITHRRFPWPRLIDSLLEEYTQALTRITDQIIAGDSSSSSKEEDLWSLDFTREDYREFPNQPYPSREKLKLDAPFIPWDVLISPLKKNIMQKLGAEIIFREKSSCRSPGYSSSYEACVSFQDGIDRKLGSFCSTSRLAVGSSIAVNSANEIPPLTLRPYGSSDKQGLVEVWEGLLNSETACSQGDQCEERKKSTISGRSCGPEFHGKCSLCADLNFQKLRELGRKRLLESVRSAFGPSTDYAWEQVYLLASRHSSVSQTPEQRAEEEREALRKQKVEAAIDRISGDSSFREAFETLELKYQLLVHFIRLAFPESLQANGKLRGLLLGESAILSGNELRTELLKKEYFRKIWTRSSFYNTPDLIQESHRNDMLRSILAKDSERPTSPHLRVRSLKAEINRMMRLMREPEIDPAMKNALRNLRIFLDTYSLKAA